MPPDAEGHNASPPQSPAARRLRRLYVVAALLMLIAAGLLLALPSLSRTQAVRDRVQRIVADAGFETQIGDLGVGYDLALHLRDLSIASPGQPPFATVEAATAGISLIGLLRGQPFAVEVTAPRLFLAHLPAGGDGGGPVSIPFRSIAIEHGYIVTAGDEEFGPLTVSVDAVQHGQEARLSLEVDPRLPPLDVTGSAHIDAGEIVVDAVQLQWTSVPLALLAERFPEMLPPTIAGTLDLSGTAAGPLTRLGGTGSLEITGMSATVAGLEAAVPSCLASGSFERSAELIGFKGTVSATGIRAHDATHERALENVDLNGSLEASWKPSGSPLLRLDLTAASGEILWQRVYADLAQYPLQVRGNAEISATSVEVSNLEASAKGLGSFTAEMRLRPYSTLDKLDARIEIPDLDPLFALAVRDPLRESYAFLADTSVKGRLRVGGQYRRTKAGASLKGDLRLTDTTMLSAAPAVGVRGLDIELPLRFGALAPAATPRGRIHLDGMTLGDLQLPATTAALQVDVNRIALAEPLAVPLLGGWLRVHELEATTLDTSKRRVSLGIAVESVGLTALTETMGWPPLSGTITGAVPKVTVDAQQVRSEGEIRISVFEGGVVIKNLHVDQLFSSIPTLGLDLDFDGISLARLTKTLEVGSISGVVRGGVNDLALVNGEPLSFDAWMETVPQSGVSQRVSVAAIRQLSVLGGSGGDPFSQGILGFFDEYRYAKMGFRCRLENDKFRLRGVEQKDGKDYLIVGSRLPPRVDVVSHNQVVSFSEMVRRLQRVGASASDTEKGEQQ